MSFGSNTALSVLFLLGVHGTAGAEDLDATVNRRVRELYDQAGRIYNAKDYAAAIPYLQAAFALQPTPQLLFNIAQAYRKLDQYNSARVYFELYRSTEKELTREKSALIDGFILEMREREAAAQASQVKVKVVETTKLVYVQSERPVPRWLRPLGITAGLTGLAMLGGGGAFLGLNGRCASDPIAPALECDQTYSTQTPGIALTAAGAGVLLLGVIGIGVSFKKPARPVVVPQSASPKERPPVLPEALPVLPAPDEEPPPSGEPPLTPTPKRAPDPNRP